MQAARVTLVRLATCCALSACSGTRGSLLVSDSRDGGDLTDARPGPSPDAALDAQSLDPLWIPQPGASFQVQLTGAIDTSLDVEVYVIDLDSPAADFATLRSAGRRIACHFSAGTVETFRDDAVSIPDSAWGNTPDAYPDERWLDITVPEARSVMQARLERARASGCSAVLPENLAVHLQDSGFEVTEAEALDYARFLASEARARGLSTMLSSGELAGVLASDVQIGLGFGCLSDGCAVFQPLRTAGKPLMVVEVGDADSAPQLCASAREQGLNLIVKRSNFDAFRISCP